MKIIVEPVDLKRDRNVLIATLRQYLTPTSDERRFDWLYRQNPHGDPKVWLARDTETGEIVGTSAAFRRRALFNGTAKNGWVLGDFCIAEKYRSLGPALQLQRATLAAIAELPESHFCYDFPSLQLTAIYRRLGVQPAAHMVRLVKPLRVDEKLRRFGRLAQWAWPATWLGNAALCVSDWKLGTGKSWNIQLHEGECGREFNELREKTRAASGVEIQRSAEYLNWRYLRHPFFPHHILTARKAGELQGYLVYTCGDGIGQIAEWCAPEDPALLSSLVRDLVCRMRKARVSTLNACLLQQDPRMSLLKKFGFWPRESTPVMVNQMASSDSHAFDWFLMYGDRDS